MRLYNSLTKQIEDFIPFEKGKVRMYSCGPTVYNNLHIGNLSAFIYADLLRRVLAASEYEVHAVMNITDVDDKTIRDSRRDYPDLDPMEALSKLTRKYEDVFKNDIARIGNDLDAITFIRATETIDEMIALIQKLLDKGIAYITDDGVYFSIKQYEAAGFTYGKLQQVDRGHEVSRIANDEYDKDSVSDFALWKSAEEGEPSWSASFMQEDKQVELPGRPGWHIECSAMSDKLLGIPIDIHTGGIDLKFPHHENEIAQSMGASGQDIFAKLFVHNNHILIDGRKMSKSLGNVITLREIEERGYDPMAFRLLVLSSHYRSESNFSWEILEAAQNRLKRFRNTVSLRHQVAPQTEYAQGASIERSKDDILERIENDLDTPRALEAIESELDNFEFNGILAGYVDNFYKWLRLVDNLLGLELEHSTPDISDEQKHLIRKREEARANKDWTKSDELRDALKEQGIEVKDTSQGTVWSRA